MTRQECEKKIGEKLEEIRALLVEYDPDIEMLSMYVSKRASSAWALTDGDDSEYLIKVDMTKGGDYE